MGLVETPQDFPRPVSFLEQPPEARWDMRGVFRGATHPWHLNCSFRNLRGEKKQNSAASPTNGYKSPTVAVLVEQNKA